jgi:hypothetical protein
MGIHLDRNGGCQDLQIQPLLYAWDDSNPNLDYADRDGTFRLGIGPQHKLLGTFMWARFWLWM